MNKERYIGEGEFRRRIVPRKEYEKNKACNCIIPYKAGELSCLECNKDKCTEDQKPDNLINLTNNHILVYLSHG